MSLASNTRALARGASPANSPPAPRGSSREFGILGQTTRVDSRGRPILQRAPTGTPVQTVVVSRGSDGTPVATGSPVTAAAPRAVTPATSTTTVVTGAGGSQQPIVLSPSTTIEFQNKGSSILIRTSSEGVDDNGDFGLNEDADLQEWEDKTTQEASYPLEPTLATYAFIALVKPRDKLPCALLHAVAYPWMLLVGTYLMQLAMVYAVQDKVTLQKNLAWSQLYDIYSDGLEGVSGLGMPRLGADDIDKVCGGFSFERYNDTAISWGNQTDQWTFMYSREPNDDWGSSILGGERENTLDTSLYILTTRSLGAFFDVPFSHMFKIVVFIWVCVVSADLSSQWSFLQYLCLARTLHPRGYVSVSDSEEGGQTTEKLLSKDEDGNFIIEGLTVTAKVLGGLIAVLEIILAIWVLVVGLAFLMGTTTRLDLILNAVALGFLFELDDVVYAAGVSQLTKRFIENVELAKLPTGHSLRKSKQKRLTKHIGGLATLFCACLVAVVAREFQYKNHSDMFNLAAATCLFLGPSPDDGNTKFDAVFPVPGLCESLLDLRCDFPAGKCYGDHAEDTMCNYYDSESSPARTPLKIFSPNSTTETRYCISDLGNAEGEAVSSVGERLSEASVRGMPGIDMMRQICLAMWQPSPCSEPCGEGVLETICKRKTLSEAAGIPMWEATNRLQQNPNLPYCLGAPRKRGVRGESEAYAAPFWCPYTTVASQILTEGSPQELGTKAALDFLQNCKGQRLPAPPRRPSKLR